MVIVNVVFDPIAITQGIAFLLFCIPVVLLCEFEVYRIFYRKQGVLRAILTVLYANAISGIAGIIIFETLTDISGDISHKLGYSEAGLVNNITLFVLMLVCTWLIEVGVLYPLRRKLKMSNLFIGVGIANFVSYIAVVIMLIVKNVATIE
jgi:hypothetical protein